MKKAKKKLRRTNHKAFNVRISAQPQRRGFGGRGKSGDVLKNSALINSGVRPKKILGQNFIIDKDTLLREVKCANLTNSDVVLEIGAGTGNLTELLAQSAKKVIVIEIDKQFERQLLDLQKTYNNIEVIWGDAIEIELPKFNKVVANLPFNISLPLTFKLLKYDFDMAILVYQKREAERLCAQVGRQGYCRIGVTLSRNADARIIEMISKEKFCPQPDVDGAIVEIKKTKEKFEIPSEEFFKWLLEHLFANRRESVESAILKLHSKKFNKLVLTNVLNHMSSKIKEKIISQLSPQQFSKISWVLRDELKN